MSWPIRCCSCETVVWAWPVSMMAGDGVSVTPPAVGVFLERGDDLRVLEDSLVAVRTTQEGRLVFVAGEAGWARRR